MSDYDEPNSASAASDIESAARDRQKPDLEKECEERNLRERFFKAFYTGNQFALDFIELDDWCCEVVTKALKNNSGIYNPLMLEAIKKADKLFELLLQESPVYFRVGEGYKTTALYGMAAINMLDGALPKEEK